MEMNKQDEKLLQELLKKYKQGNIFGLYSGSNITLTPRGCRDKIISSTSTADDTTASNGLTESSGNIKLGGRTTDAMTVISVGSPVDNPIGGVGFIFSDTATRPTITKGAYADNFSFVTGSEVVNFNTVNTQIAQFGMFNQASVNDLDDTKLFFVNANGVKQTFLIGMPDDTTVEGTDVVILNPLSKEIKTINKTALLGTSVHTIFTPLTGASINLVSKNYNIVNPAGAIAALTVNLPSAPNNNDTVIIKFIQDVTTVTYANGTVLGGLISPTKGSQLTLVYDTASNAWY